MSVKGTSLYYLQIVSHKQSWYVFASYVSYKATVLCTLQLFHLEQISGIGLFRFSKLLICIELSSFTFFNIANKNRQRFVVCSIVKRQLTALYADLLFSHNASTMQIFS